MAYASAMTGQKPVGHAGEDAYVTRVAD